MILNLDDILEQELTRDTENQNAYENYKELYASGTVEMRVYGIEREIKLNRLERKERPMKLLQERDGSYYCPICRKGYDSVFHVSRYCGYCGQRIQLP